MYCNYVVAIKRRDSDFQFYFGSDEYNNALKAYSNVGGYPNKEVKLFTKKQWYSGKREECLHHRIID